MPEKRERGGCWREVRDDKWGRAGSEREGRGGARRLLRELGRQEEKEEGVGR